MNAQDIASSERLAYSTDEAAQALGISVATVKRAISRKLIRSVRVGSRRLIPTEELRRVAAEGIAM